MMIPSLLWKLDVLAVALTLLATACSPVPSSNATATPAFASPSPAPSQTPLPTPTPVPPSPTATVTPVEGTVTAQINVRSGPDVSYSSISTLNSGDKIQIIGKDPSGGWYGILYPSAPQGHGWVLAVYIQAGDTAGLPVVALQEEGSGLTGKATQTLNVRSGPGTDYEVLGMIQPDTVLVLTGKNEAATWLQVEYAAGASSKGWVTAAYVQTNDTASLPVLNASGTPVTPDASGPTSIPVTPTPTLGPASADDDSSAAPAIQVAFSPAGTRQFSYTSDVSSPQGDAEDWVAFTPYTSLAGSPARVLLNLVCNGNGALDVELWRNGASLADWGELACGDQDKPLDLAVGAPYQFRLRTSPGDGLRYVHYTLTVRNGP
jgi:uncharacterized protein YgiM (DUF1202 family)